ncbi:hypothetical protein, partial [Ilumatobacter sp.]|uniref:hypothetical protein n=1 Tax=Ilumatobacter sp. TaxID=1967498 RepID=UPI003C6875FB
MTTADSSSHRSADTTEASDSGPSITARVLPWVARFAWLLVAVVGGGAVESAVDGRSDPVRWTTAIGAWALFGIVAIALLIPAAV